MQSERTLHQQIPIEVLAKILTPSAKSFVGTVINIEQRPEFFSDPLCIDILTNNRLLQDKESWQKLKQLGQLSYPALAIQTYLDVQEDKQFLKWTSKAKGFFKTDAWEALIFKGE